MSLSKKKILIYSPGKNILHRDLVDSNFYSFLNKSFDITWIFSEEPSEQFKKKKIKNYKVIKEEQNHRLMVWTFLYYLGELKVCSFWKWPNLNTKLYLSKKLKFLINAIYNLKFDFFLKYILKIYLNYTFKKFNFFKEYNIFLTFNGGKDSFNDDLMRNAKRFNLFTIHVPAGWDNIGSKPIFIKPDKILVWGNQSKYLCKQLHKINPIVFGTARFELLKNNKVTKKKALNKLGLSSRYKYILVAGSGVAFNEMKLINRTINYLNKNKLFNYKIIFRPHPHAQKRYNDEKIDFKTNPRVLLDPTIKRNYRLKDYPYLMSSMEGIITPYSTTIFEALSYNLPCLAVGYNEENRIIFNWKSFVINSPHLRVLKNRKFIISCLDSEDLELKLSSFLKLIKVNHKYNTKRQKFLNNVILNSKDSYNNRMKKLILGIKHDK